jgi:hypothetical protein
MSSSACTNVEVTFGICDARRSFGINTSSP